MINFLVTMIFLMVVTILILVGISFTTLTKIEEQLQNLQIPTPGRRREKSGGRTNE